MNVSQFQKNRAVFPQELLDAYQGQWIAFSGDGLSVLANANTLDKVENELATLGVDPQEVFLERVPGPEDDILLGGGDLR